MTRKKSNKPISERHKLCVIPARKGSKGVPEKNSRALGGQPLVAWTIQAAIRSAIFDRIVVSSDCPKIRDISTSLEVEFDWRPSELGMDNIHASRVVLDILNRSRNEVKTQPESVAMLLPTSPLRTVDHIRKAAEIMDTSDCSSVVGVMRSGKYLNNIRILQSDYLFPIVGKSALNNQRQEQEELLFVNGAMFFARTDLFLKQKTFHINPCAPLEMDQTSSIDINTEEDFNQAEKIISVTI